MQVKNLNQLNSEKKLFLMMLIILFFVVNTFVLYVSYSRVRTNLEQAASNIVNSMNIDSKENSRIAYLMAAKLQPNSEFDKFSESNNGEPTNNSLNNEELYEDAPEGHNERDALNSYFNVTVDFSKMLSRKINIVTPSYYTNGEKVFLFSEKSMNLDSINRAAQGHYVKTYLQETTNKLNNLHGFAVPDLFYSNIYNAVNSQFSWITLGVPVVIKNHVTHLNSAPGIIATDYTSDELYALLNKQLKQNRLDINRYDINVHSLAPNGTTMKISTSFFSLFNFKIPDISLTNGYYITASVNLRSLINTAPGVFINTNLLLTFVSLLFLTLHNSSLDMLNRLITDSLTQALSREGGRLVIEGMSAKDGQVVVVTDLNDFKIINDTYGHQTGDEALVYFSRYIMNSLSEKDSMIRMGGDEFMLLFRDISVQQVMEKMALLAEGLHSFPHEQCEIPLTFSYGVSEVTSDFSDCYKKADQRLYQMKKQHHAQKS